jgi:hypothetical protein
LDFTILLVDDDLKVLLFLRNLNGLANSFFFGFTLYRSTLATLSFTLPITIIRFCYMVFFFYSLTSSFGRFHTFREKPVSTFLEACEFTFADTTSLYLLCLEPKE